MWPNISETPRCCLKYWWGWGVIPQCDQFKLASATFTLVPQGSHSETLFCCWLYWRFLQTLCRFVTASTSCSLIQMIPSRQTILNFHLNHCTTKKTTQHENRYKLLICFNKAHNSETNPLLLHVWFFGLIRGKGMGGPRFTSLLLNTSSPAVSRLAESTYKQNTTVITEQM